MKTDVGNGMPQSAQTTKGKINSGRRHLRLGGAKNSCACISMHMLGLRLFLRPLLAQSGTTVIIVIYYHCLHMYDSNLYRRPHAMQWPLLNSPNFWVSSAEYYIGLLSLGQGHNIARVDTRPLGSVQHAARLETSWPGRWLRYLAAVVSICVYTVSNKGGLPSHCHDCRQSWELCPHALYFVGATAPTTPWFRHLWRY